MEANAQFNRIFDSLIIMLLCLSGIASGYDPCTNATDISDYRRSASYIPSQTEILQSDDWIVPGWYSFGGQMPDSCIDQFHCDTQIPIWFNGIHPPVGASNPVNATVCAQYPVGSCCGWSSQIQVKGCNLTGSVTYVYFLTATPSNLAYCGEPCHSGHSWNRNTGTCELYNNLSTTETVAIWTPTDVSNTVRVSTTVPN
jgi:hypothetical protein